MYTSFFYETNEGITIKDNRKDYGGRLNANFKLFDGWLEIRPIVDYRQTARTSDGSDEDKKANFKQALYNNPTRSPLTRKARADITYGPEKLWTTIS